MHKPHKALHRFGKHYHGHNLKAPNLPKLVNIHSCTHWRPMVFSSAVKRISKSLIHCCDNYPCCSPMEHLHNHHQPFTEDTQRIIMRQQRNKKHFRGPLKTGTERAVIVAWYCAQDATKQEERCSDRLFRGGKKSQKCFGRCVPKYSCCITRRSLLRLLYSWRVGGEVSQRVGSEKNPLILNKLAVATITVGGSSRRCQIYLPLQ